ncbi:hypothetical protein FEMY_01490 [Ferrovum myxofaciens]|jgi:hypothetical protein|uniref:Uncharacterized protein n=1 Tax=Ferrovum myxofaciens TaxID=416213 RepID=A0A149W1A9_9PROT|nr:hypothetical protein FEMY_01490 [Ferrovum myxofaciens]
MVQHPDRVDELRFECPVQQVSEFQRERFLFIFKGNFT